MNKLRRKIYMAAGYNTISMGTGRKEFNPKKDRPGLEHYISEAGRAAISVIGDAALIDEVVIGNFMASRFNKQGHLGGFAGMIDKKLEFKPSTRTEGACCSGGLALMSGIRSVLAETSDVVMALGVEVQNTVKAIYGADILAGAGWFQNRKNGHAYFFPGQFSDRAGAYYEKFGKEYARKGMGRWFRNAIENARLCPTAQEYENAVTDLDALYQSMEPNGASFVDHLNVLDCSKVSDGASAILILSEEGLRRCGIKKTDAVEITGWAHAVRNITDNPIDLTKMQTIGIAVHQAMESAGITKEQLATIEVHDCFSIAGVLGTEAFGFAGHGQGAAFVAEGNTARDGMIPINTTGGLIGWGHPTGGTGVHQAVTIWEQLTGKAGKAQINIPSSRPFGMTVNMGGDDGTVVSLVYRKGE